MTTMTRISREQQTITWAELRLFFLRYRWLVLTTFLVFVGGGWLALQIFFTDLYETKVSLLVKIGRENAETPTTVVNGQVLSQGVRIQDINSEVQLLSSRSLIESVVDKIGPESFRSVLKRPESIWGYPKYVVKTAARAVKSRYKELLIAVNLKKRLTPREEAILAVGDGLKIEPVKESDVLTLKLRLPSPELCVRTANVLIEDYLETRAKVRMNDAGRSLFDKETREQENELEELMNRRAQVRRTWDVSSPAEQRSLILKQLSELTGGRTDIEGQIRKLQSERAEIIERLKTTPLVVEKEQQDSRNPALESLKERSTSLKMERAKLLGRYLPDSELVQKTNTEIASLEDMLARENPTVLASSTHQANPLHTQLQESLVQHEIQIAGLASRNEQLTQPIAALQTKLRELDKGADSVEKADRDYRLAEQSYFAYFKRRAEARLEEQLDTRQLANVALFGPPETPIEPVYPRKLFIMGILIPVGLLVGVAISAFMVSLDDRLHSEGDLLASPGVAFLGNMPPPAAREGENTILSW